MSIIDSMGCTTCALCCKNYPFVRLSLAEVRSLEEFTKLRIDAFAESKGKSIADYFLTFKENGDCYFLDEENGIYSCRVYETRPEICERYPSTTKQKTFCSEHMNAFCR